MIRRRSLLKLMGAGMVVAGTPLTAQPVSILIYDGRFARARAFAADATHAHDCSQDAAQLWYAAFAGRTLPLPLHGLTTRADALILADLARREGHALSGIRPAAGASQLCLWNIGRAGTHKPD